MMSKSDLDLNDTKNKTSAKKRRDKKTLPSKPPTQRLQPANRTVRLSVGRFLDPSSSYPLVGVRLNGMDDPFLTATPFAV
jgi:hypothetical protein